MSQVSNSKMLYISDKSNNVINLEKNEFRQGIQRGQFVIYAKSKVWSYISFFHVNWIKRDYFYHWWLLRKNMWWIWPFCNSFTTFHFLYIDRLIIWLYFALSLFKLFKTWSAVFYLISTKNEHITYEIKKECRSQSYEDKTPETSPPNLFGITWLKNIGKLLMIIYQLQIIYQMRLTKVTVISTQGRKRDILQSRAFHLRSWKIPRTPTPWPQIWSTEIVV